MIIKRGEEPMGLNKEVNIWNNYEHCKLLWYQNHMVHHPEILYAKIEKYLVWVLYVVCLFLSVLCLFLSVSVCSLPVYFCMFMSVLCLPVFVCLSVSL